MKHKNIQEITDFTPKELQKLIKETIKFKKSPLRKKRKLKNKRIGLMFDANSLRTKLSFETAAHYLGASTYFIDSKSVTHEKDGTKRETYEDITDTLDRMVDMYVVRDYSQELLEVLQRKNYPPIINGFCQIGHPSQALADLSVIKWKKKKLHKLTYVGICPSTGSGVMESFIYGVLLLGESITIITETGKFFGKNKDFNDQVTKLSNNFGGSLTVTAEIKDVIAKADILYVDEWWENNENFLKKDIGALRVDSNLLKNTKKDLSILHCLPAHPGREITEDVMRSPQSLIFDEAEFRIYSAMALLAYLAN